MNGPDDERPARWALAAARAAIVWAAVGALQLGCGESEERPGAGRDPRGRADAGARADASARHDHDAARDSGAVQHGNGGLDGSADTGRAVDVGAAPASDAWADVDLGHDMSGPDRDADPDGGGHDGGGDTDAGDGDAGTAPIDIDGAVHDPRDAPCPDDGLEPGDHEFSLEHDGARYEYLVHVPPGYDPTVRTPLVLNWHGLTSNARRQRDFSAMNPVADARNFIVVYPNSPDTSWNAGTCCRIFVRDRDDVGFAVALVDEMQTRACIDARRVYSTGFSNGGYMSHRLACERADVFAAVAPVSGTLSPSTCNPSRPIPVIHFHGTADRNVRYEGGGLTRAVSVPDTLQGWADRNGCAPEPAVTFAEDDATCETWTDCDDDVEVTLCSFEGVAHCWPGQANCPYGATTTTLDASEEAARFFERFHL